MSLQDNLLVTNPRQDLLQTLKPGPAFFILFLQCYIEAYSEPCQTVKMDRFAKIVNGFKPFTIFVKRSVLDAGQGSE